MIAVVFWTSGSMVWATIINVILYLLSTRSDLHPKYSIFVVYLAVVIQVMPMAITYTKYILHQKTPFMAEPIGVILVIIYFLLAIFYTLKKINDYV